MCASLQSAGTEPEDREDLKRIVSAGAISGKLLQHAWSYAIWNTGLVWIQVLRQRCYLLGDLDVLHGWEVTVMHASLLHEFFCVPLAIAKG